MAFTYQQFIIAFPALANGSNFPKATVCFYIPHAYAQLNMWRFGGELDYAAMLWVAHTMVLDAQTMAAANAGGIPGDPPAPTTEKHVDKVGKGMDPNLTADPNAGILNATVYGQRLWQMMKMYLGGPLYFVPYGQRARFTL